MKSQTKVASLHPTKKFETPQDNKIGYRHSLQLPQLQVTSGVESSTQWIYLVISRNQ